MTVIVQRHAGNLKGYADARGTSMIEYLILVMFVVVVALAAVKAFQGQVGETFDTVVSAIPE